MKVLILHLSDIHFKSSKDVILSRVEQIKGAVQSAGTNVNVRFLVVTGDIAYSGDPAQYELGLEFFTELTASIRKIDNAIQLFSVYVPGNHDCNFTGDLDARQSLIENLGANIEKLQKGNSIINICLSVQNEFFNFLDTVTQGELKIEERDRIYYEKVFYVDTKTIKFKCYNTAWVSQRHENPKHLYYPIAGIDDDKQKYDLVLSLFHHPYTWLQPDNARAFRKHIESSTDIVLTGHEHDSSFFEHRDIKGYTSHYTEGALLQEDNNPKSGLNILLIDLNERLMQVFQYNWDGSLYKPIQEPKWQEFHRSKSLRQQEFENNETFLNKLSGLGVAFSHPVVAKLKLQDLFVYPDIEEQAFEKKSDASIFSTISGERVFEYVLSNKHSLFMGENLSGKSSLAKILYMDLQKRGNIPILVDGESIKSSTYDDVSKIMDKTYEQQYDKESLEKYRQLDQGARVLIVDDFHKSKLNKVGQNEFLIVAKKLFEKIIIFADELFPLERITEVVDHNNPLLEFCVFYIREMGHDRRGELIEKWCKLGREYTIQEDELSYEVANAEHLINTLLGKRLIPSLPLFILTILQTREATIPLNTTSGAYGQYYEFLINQALTKKMMSKSTDIIYAYISRIAHYLFSNRKKNLSEAELLELNSQYYDEIKVRVNPETILKDLLNVGVLQQVGDRYKFTYSYYYYYFVANFIAKNIKNPVHELRLREQVKDIIEHVYVEDFANILIFLVYMTRDPEIIQQMLDKTKKVYNDYDLCDLEEHIRFINQLPAKLPSLAISLDDVERNKRERRKQLDDLEQNNHFDEDEAAKQEKEMDDVLRLNIAFKTLQIMGQILRNFPGSLEGDIKLEIAKESYFLGLRTLRALFSILETNLAELSELIASHLKETKNITNEQELRDKTDQFLFYFMLFFAYGLIKKVSNSVGSEELRETYKEVLEQNPSTPISLIDISIKIDHFRALPVEEIIELYKSLKKNLFSSNILRHMVWDYLQLYNVQRPIKERLCSKLDIAIKNPKILSRETKILK